MDKIELDFTEICRCCKRKESGMASIFTESVQVHHMGCTYPPVKEMLISIASLNVQENDELPSLVCTVCLGNIQNAFTFILQIIQIDAELRQMLADTVKKECVQKENELFKSEDVNHSFKVQDLDVGNTANCYEHIDLAVKLEQDQYADENVEESEPQVVNEQSKRRRKSDIDDYSRESSEGEANVNEGADDLDAEEISRKRQRTTLNLDDALVYKCKLCAYSSPLMYNLKLHLQSHFKDRPFACAKCTGTFTQRANLQRHSRKCNGEHKHDADKDKEKPSKQVISLTLEELEDPEKIKKYYTVSEGSDGKNKHSDGRRDDQVEEISFKSRTTERRNSTSKLTVFNCNLCDATITAMYDLKQHLLTHSQEKPFACSKCNGTFTARSSMLRHWRNCNGERNKYAHKAKASKQLITLTVQDLKDPEKMKKYYTAREIEPGTPFLQKTTCKLTVFKCKLCEYTSALLAPLKLHLSTHCNGTSFACLKCNRTFSKRSYMRHLQFCNGDIGKCASYKEGPSNQEMSLTLHDLRDPEKMKEFYSVTEINV